MRRVKFRLLGLSCSFFHENVDVKAIGRCPCGLSDDKWTVKNFMTDFCALTGQYF